MKIMLIKSKRGGVKYLTHFFSLRILETSARANLAKASSLTIFQQQTKKISGLVINSTKVLFLSLKVNFNGYVGFQHLSQFSKTANTKLQYRKLAKSEQNEGRDPPERVVYSVSLQQNSG